MPADALADAVLDDLVVRTTAGDETSWRHLWAAIEPRLAEMVASPRFLGRLSRREDDRRNIVVEVMARLRADDFHRLHLFLDAKRENPRLAFMTWLRVVAKRVGIDYLRGHPEYMDRRAHAAASPPGEWVETETLPPASQLASERPPVTKRGTAQEMLRYAAGAIPDTQRRALELWIQGEPFAQIAGALRLAGAEDAARMIRAAIERLRRQFRAEVEE